MSAGAMLIMLMEKILYCVSKLSNLLEERFGLPAGFVVSRYWSIGMLVIERKTKSR